MAAKVAVIAGFGPGISSAVGRRFGAAGFSLALLSRTQHRLDAAVAAYAQAGITAKGFATDLADDAAVRATLATVRRSLGPPEVLFYNPVATPARGVLEVTADELAGAFAVTCNGLVAAVQAARPDLAERRGAVLVTNGGLALESDAMAQGAVDWGMASLAVSKAAQRKLVHILSKALAKDGIYVAEVTVTTQVQSAPGGPGIPPDDVADAFMALWEARDAGVWCVSKP